MKRKNIIFAAGVCLLSVFAGCTANFDELNKNPNLPSRSDLSISDQILAYFPVMIHTILHSQQNSSQHVEQMVGQYGGHITVSSVWGDNNFANLRPQPNYISAPWERGYTPLSTNYTQVAKLTKKEGYLYHLANIIKVASLHRIVDMYGPIPYDEDSEFESVKDAYIMMIDELSEAIDVLTEIANTAPTSPLRVASYDKVYNAGTGAALLKWVKYANSLKLRLAVRIALMPETADLAKTAITEVMTDGTGPIMQNADNAFNAAIPENVVAGYYCGTSWGDLRVNAVLTTYMNAWKDPRTLKYMKPGVQTTPYDYTGNVGVRMGAVVPSNVTKFDSDDLDPNVAPATYTIMNVTDPEPVMLFCAAETQFLLAEAAARGWYTGAGDAKTLYETGIQRSMEQYGVPLGSYMSETMTAAEGVYTDPDPAENPAVEFDMFASFSDLTPSSTLDVAYPDGGTLEQQIEAIITQKWLANYRLGLEAWSDWRRTGYPRIFPAANTDRVIDDMLNPTTNIDPKVPRMARRLSYPQLEQVSSGYADALAKLGGADLMTTEIWWAQGNQPK